MARRTFINERVGQLDPHCSVVTWSSYPSLGSDMDCIKCYEHAEDRSLNECAKSDYLHNIDQFIHPLSEKYLRLTNNLVERKGKAVSSLLPLFSDIATDPFVAGSSHPGFVHLDSIAFGCSCCCAQVTVSGSDLEETKYLHDVLAVLAPIMLSMTASTPIIRGFLTNHDVRWKVISETTDDRRDHEQQYRPRYDSVGMYLSKCSNLSDVTIPYCCETFNILSEGGMDERLAKHFAVIFNRDPLLVIGKDLALTDQQGAAKECTEMFLSTVWPSVKFKIPCDVDQGWRVEFRVMEIQPNDFENAAFIVFVLLFTRMCLHFAIKVEDFLIPFLNLIRTCNYVKRETRYWRSNFIYFHCLSIDSERVCSNGVKLLTVNEIVNGSSSNGHVGILPLIRLYLATVTEESSSVESYLSHIESVSVGETPTVASKIRELVMNHPLYKQDSVVSPKVAQDVICSLCRM